MSMLTQTPFTQSSPGSHGSLDWPQWRGSTTTWIGLHSPSSPHHCPVLQGLPEVPQLYGSVLVKLRGTHDPVIHSSPGLQAWLA